VPCFEHPDKASLRVSERGEGRGAIQSGEERKSSGRGGVLPSQMASHAARESLPDLWAHSRRGEKEEFAVEVKVPLPRRPRPPL